MLFVSRARHAVGALTKAGAATRTLASLPDQGPEVVSGLQPVEGRGGHEKLGFDDQEGIVAFGASSRTARSSRSCPRSPRT